jgi:hypothetical protein
MEFSALTFNADKHILHKQVEKLQEILETTSIL